VVTHRQPTEAHLHGEAAEAARQSGGGKQEGGETTGPKDADPDPA